MVIKREDINKIKETINKMGDKKFDIQTQYKLLKIKRAAQEEEDLYQEQMMINCKKFFELDNNGQPVMSEKGGFKIKPDKISECNQFLNKMEKVLIQVPDIYFTIEELEKLDLTLEELDAFIPFIK